MVQARSRTEARALSVSFEKPHSLQALLAVLLIAISPLFFVGGPDWASTPLIKASWDLGHILFFALFTLSYQLLRGVGGARQAIGVSIAVLILGMMIEALQSFIGREVSWADVMGNLTGAWLVMAWRQSTRCTTTGRRVVIWLCRGISLLLLVAYLLPVISQAHQQTRLAIQFPLLTDFADPASIRNWTGDVKLAHNFGPRAAPGMAIMLDTGRYSGAFLNRLHGDWSAYRQLNLSLFNPDATTVSLTLRINDLQHDRGSNAYNDRFNQTITLQPGWNRYEIQLEDVASAPSSRLMDMTRIRRLGLFTSKVQVPRTVFLTDLRLDGRKPGG
ncbi:succinyl-CoA synthetase subunit beta [Hydrocarboniclastica marina]|uniref:Succinyl-CoA synthetase subunit beta n=1 Tax=Hydrocarboniclastica marina TaxID=2259620 RepID=A0A4P7XJ78_9ALTE|nr:succinyl-CoA synthetase subunit beta [Hydrocarboniclastica marina]QCF26815.1 succinyl-CoA synthetase subunit beta [Hydrocarboniclastica marina]